MAGRPRDLIEFLEVDFSTTRVINQGGTVSGRCQAPICKLRGPEAVSSQPLVVAGSSMVVGWADGSPNRASWRRAVET